MGMANLSDRNQIALLFTTMGVVCSGLFAGVCWMAKLAIMREIARLDKLAQDRRRWEREINEWRTWVMLILSLHKLVPIPLPPGPVLNDE